MWKEIAEALRGKKLAFFLDYDGTLTPIAERPEFALLKEEQREILKRLAEKYPVAIISGRDRENVAALVGLPGLYYAGSHGFDIAGPSEFIVEMGEEYLPALALAANRLATLKSIPGLQIERKKFAIAIHFRQCDPAKIPEIEQRVQEVQRRIPALRLRKGKMIFELQPDIDWDKGKAVLHLIELMGLGREVIPVFIGDDATDEDAFNALPEGVTIGVFPENTKTAARYRLTHPDEVFLLFQWLTKE